MFVFFNISHNPKHKRWLSLGLQNNSRQPNTSLNQSQLPCICTDSLNHPSSTHPPTTLPMTFSKTQPQEFAQSSATYHSLSPSSLYLPPGLWAQSPNCMPPGMFVQHVYDSPSVVDAAVADVNERGRGKRLEHAVPLGSNLDDLDLLRRLREVEKDSYGKVVAEETGEREKLKKEVAAD